MIVLHLGPVHIGADATIGSRSTLLPGAWVGEGAEIEPGSAVVGRVPRGARWSGSPAGPVGKARRSWPDHRPPAARRWLLAFGAGVRR